MPRPASTSAVFPTFLARAYMFERDRLARSIRAGDPYVLPACWRDHPVWAKLRAAAAARDIDPVRYVRWSLELGQIGLPVTPPEPNRLLERGRLELYVSELPRRLREIQIRFAREKEKAIQTMIVEYDEEPAEVAWFGALASGDRNQLSPLAQYVLARAVGTRMLRKFAEDLKPDAALQFSRDPAENGAVYGASGHLPPGFAGLADWVYTFVVERHSNQAARGVRA
jgi:hypothetical protein